MPELPEVETTCNGIRPYVESQVISAVDIREHRLRWPVDKTLPDLLKNKKIQAVERRAKYILLVFDIGYLAIHLGMSGSLKVIRDGLEASKHDHIDILLKNREKLRFHDPRRFGSFVWIPSQTNYDQSYLSHKLFKNLGPEPLSQAFGEELLFKLSRNRRTPIKSLIMNANIVVGVGNIYANEALFRSGIRPTREAGGISKKRYGILADNIKQVLEEAIKQGGTTLNDFVSADGNPGYFKQELAVYGRAEEPCLTCGKDLKEIRISGRSTVFCNKCQT